MRGRNRAYLTQKFDPELESEDNGNDGPRPWPSPGEFQSMSSPPPPVACAKWIRCHRNAKQRQDVHIVTLRHSPTALTNMPTVMRTAGVYVRWI
ncbi:hypothetical protein J6590_051273 [Homalodisca vitripennis]|nr:hypothetical protein J6590_051273 [Homalodisca vitripennis]